MLGRFDRHILRQGAKEGADMNQLVYNGKTFYQKDIFSGNVHIAMSLRSSSLEVNTLFAERHCRSILRVYFERIQ